jgi:hypothetical protein
MPLRPTLIGVAIYLQEKGFDALGVDISALAIRVCKLRDLRKAKLISITQLSPQVRNILCADNVREQSGLFCKEHKTSSLSVQ